MNIEVGDKVRFLNEEGEGIVTRIQNQLAYILIEEGFEIPSPVNRLVLIEKKVNQPEIKLKPTDADTMNYNFIEREELSYDDISDKINAPFDEALTNDIYLAFIHENKQKPDSLSLYIINDSKQYLTYCIFDKKVKDYHFIETGILEPETKIITGEYTKEETVQLSTIAIQGVLFNPSNQSKGEWLDREVKINSLYLLDNNYFKENDFFDEPAFILSVLKSEKNQQLLKKQKIDSDISEIPSPHQEIKPDKSDIIEIDLHIQELVDDYKNLSPSEMLHIQVNHFRKKLEECIFMNHVKKVVFIHGVGNGTLKFELRKILSNEYGHYDYQDASFQEYGFGATMVILRK